MKRIVFYYCSVELAGAENQIIRLCNGFIDLGFDVYVCDTQPSIIKQHCVAVKLIKPGEYLSHCDVAVYFMSDLLQAETDLNIGNISNRVIWNVHPDNAYWHLPKAKRLQDIFSFNQTFFRIAVNLIYPFKYKKIFHLLNVYKDSIYFMDDYNLVTFQKLFPDVERPRYLPIISEAPMDTHIHSFQNNTCSILFIGRLVDFKVKPLILFIKELASCGVFNNYLINVVGTGPSITQLKKLPTFANIKINFYGNLYGDELSALIAKASVAFAMGTSSLDLAGRGLPVILSPFGTNRTLGYCWLHETNKYDTLHSLENPQHSLHDMLTVLETDYDDLSVRHQAYVKEHHCLEKFIEKIATVI